MFRSCFTKFSIYVTTIIACEQNDRTCYGAELDARYVDVCVNRYIRAVGTDEGVFVLRDGERIPHALLTATKEA